MRMIWPGDVLAFARRAVRRRRNAMRALVTPSPRPAAPDLSAFAALAEERASAEAADGSRAVVDVIVPVHRGYDDTLACVHSVLSAQNAIAGELVVVDDASPDARLAEALGRLSDWRLVTLLRNEANCGFVGSANRGMELHPDRDVVVLNSDTIVYGDWLDRLARHAHQERVGTVTPLSNNATIMSYPRFEFSNPEPDDIAFADLDALARRVNAGQSEDIPTAVGFCMYIRRDLIREIGTFDEVTFGRGYGEENDFSMRTAEKGWRNVAALDTFVRHSGEASFGADAKRLRRDALRRVLAKHPGYLRQVQAYSLNDPSGPARRRLDVERLRAALGGERSVLCLTHEWGGGIDRHLRDERARLAADGAALVTLTPTEAHARTARLGDLDRRLDLPNLAALPLTGSLQRLERALRDLNVEEAEIHSLAGWSFEVVRSVPELFARLGLRYAFVIHDYIPVCPQINLIDGSGLYCGETGLAQCRRCVARRGTPAAEVHEPSAFPRGRIDVEAWRAAYRRVLEGAREVRAPSQDTAARMRSYLPDLRIHVTPHLEPAQQSGWRITPRERGPRLRVASIGAIGRHKGAEVLLGCAEDASRRRLPIDFSIVGHTSIDRRLRTCGNVEISGKYEEEALPGLLAGSRPDLVLLPSVWPETYSYVLTAAMRTGLPVVVFDIGAQVERLRAAGTGHRLPLAMAKTPAAINDWLLATFHDRERRGPVTAGIGPTAGSAS